MGVINPPLPTVGLPTTTEDAKTRTALAQIQDAVNNVVADQLGDNVLSVAKLDAVPAWQSVALSSTYFGAGATLWFYKDLSGVVHFKSDVKYSISTSIPENTTFATLPAGFRPAFTLAFQLQGNLNPVIALDATGALRTNTHFTVSGGTTDWWFQVQYVALG